MLRRIVDATKALLRYERALAKVTPLIQGRETRKVARAVQYAPEVPGLLAAGAVPFDLTVPHTCRVRLSAQQPVALDMRIADEGEVVVRSASGDRKYTPGLDYTADRKRSTVQALHPGIDMRAVMVEYTAIQPGGRNTCCARVLEWARGR